MRFETAGELVNYLGVKYPKSKGKELASWYISEALLLVGVYEGDELLDGFVIFRDAKKEYKWTLVDNIHAEFAVRNYIEYLTELEDAIEYHDFIEEIETKVEEEGFFEDLD